MARRKKHSLRVTLIYLAVITTLSLLAYMNKTVEKFFENRISTFELKDIKIHGNSALSRQDVLRLCGVKPGEKFLTIKPSDIAQKLLSSPFVKSASAVYSLPSTLHISLEERKPAAFVYNQKLLLVDREGVILPIPETSGHSWNLPLIYGFDGSIGKIGERTSSEQILKAIEVLEYVRFIRSPLLPMIAAIDVSNKKMMNLSLIKGGAKVRFDYRGYQDELYVLSRYIRNYLNWDQLADIDYIDLRFEDRLIIKNKKKQG